jgi:hypothetical protein
LTVTQDQNLLDVQGAPNMVVKPSRNNVQMTHLSQRQYAALWPLQQQLEACEHWSCHWFCSHQQVHHCGMFGSG